MDIKVGKTDCKVSQHSWRYRDDDIYNMFITDITSKPLHSLHTAELGLVFSRSETFVFIVGVAMARSRNF